MKSNAVSMYIDNQSSEIAQLMYLLRGEILESHPAITESLKYGVPFYTLKKNICYLTHSKKDGVYIGFIQGHKLSNEQGVLLTDGR